MRNDTLIKTFHAPTPIDGYLLVTFGGADGEVAAATAATDALIGVTTQIGTQSHGACDVVMAGVTEVKAGAAISRGAVLTADANGRAITSSQATDRVVGMALSAAAEAGDIISILVAQG